MDEAEIKQRFPGIMTPQQARPLFWAVTRKVLAAPAAPNRLDDVGRLMGAKAGTGAAEHYTLHRALMREFAGLNGLRLDMKRVFAVRTLAGRGSRLATWPGDYVAFLRRNHVAAGVVLECFTKDQLDRARSFAVSHALAFHEAPASLLHPGRSRMAVMTRADHGEVRWLPDQLTWRPQAA